MTAMTALYGASVSPLITTIFSILPSIAVWTRERNSAFETRTPLTQSDLSAVTADRSLWVNGVRVANAEFLSRVQTAIEGKLEKIVVIKGDTDAPYSAIMAVMDDLRQAGIEDIGLITERKLGRGEGGGK